MNYFPWVVIAVGVGAIGLAAHVAISEIIAEVGCTSKGGTYVETKDGRYKKPYCVSKEAIR